MYAPEKKFINKSGRYYIFNAVKKKDKKKILITAGNSNIGSDLINYFLKKNYKIFETYRNKKNRLNNSKIFHVKYNFKNKFSIKEDFDLLIHCASLTPYKYKISDTFINLNLIGLKKILYSDSRFRKIVLLSSLSVYGKINNNILSENYKKESIDAYGISKLKMEKLLINYCKKKKINYIILRLPGVVGNFQTDVNFINNIILKFSKNKLVEYKNPNSYFNNVVHTESIAKISEKLLLSKNAKFKNKILNICSVKPIKLINLINKIKNKFKSKSKIKILQSSKSFIISSKKCKKYNINLMTTDKSIEKNIDYIKKYKL
jgi:nucleoside-diphosphate-sugar epimerase